MPTKNNNPHSMLNSFIHILYRDVGTHFKVGRPTPPTMLSLRHAWQKKKLGGKVGWGCHQSQFAGFVTSLSTCFIIISNIFTIPSLIGAN